MENPTVAEVLKLKAECEEKINTLLWELIKESKMFPTYIKLEEGKAVITLSLE